MIVNTAGCFYTGEAMSVCSCAFTLSQENRLKMQPLAFHAERFGVKCLSGLQRNSLSSRLFPDIIQATSWTAHL